MDSCAHESFGGNLVNCGTLYLVPTPLGNPEDLSLRSRQILQNVDYIAAEDTRKAARLLSSLGIGNELISYYEQNAEEKNSQIIKDLLYKSMCVAVISDAGTPCISDPGASLVRKAVDHNIKVVSVPGPSAVLTALAASALDPSRFVFSGFVPPKGRKREEFFKRLLTEEYTIVFFESPHRLGRTLADMQKLGLADRRLSIARELTKEYEEFLYLDVMTAGRYFETVEPRGEFTLVLEGSEAFERRTGTQKESYSDHELEDLLRQLLLEGAGTKQAARLLSITSGVEQRRLYDMALKIAASSED